MPLNESPWPAGTPCWVDCSFDDLRSARRFYAELFGWDVPEGPAEFGHYSVALKRDHAAAGLVPRMNPESPSQWVTFFASDDLSATSDAVRAAGGTVVVEPMEVAGFGQMALFTDPEGSAFAAWHPGEHLGFGIVNEPGSVGWSTLVTQDLDAAVTFYEAVFGFSFGEMDGAVLCCRPGDGRPVGDIHVPSDASAEEQTGWLTHFIVADRDATVAIVEEIDGEVLMSFETPFGSAATVRGQEGEVFGVIALRDDAD